MRAKKIGKKGFYKSSTLALAAFSTAFYSRILCSITRLPSVLNHLHFLVVPLTTAIILTTSRPKDPKQISSVWMLLAGLSILFGVMTASALLNQAGVINIIVDFSILGGPFMLLMAIVCIPMSAISFNRFRDWIINSSYANMALAFIQWPLLKFNKISAGGLDATDGMAGVFFVSGAGNYVSTTVSIYFGIYLVMFATTVPLWVRWGTLLAAMFQLQLSDSKQVLFALFFGWGMLILLTMKDVGKTLTYTIAIILVVAVFYWCIQNVDAFAGFKNYLDKDGVYGPDGEATRIKPIAFSIIPTFYQYPLNWLLGLGPGHTAGRLGGWLLKENWAILGPLGATIHPASQALLKAYYGSWLALESTMFCPLFGWAGIWGDLGIVGLCAYLCLGWIVWRYICVDNLGRFLLLSVAGFGFIFTQMEEPGYMYFVATLIGLRWHEKRAQSLITC
ncbi:hypothetical protein [Chamaesiphon polymorphus]|uniref:Oligosaccharide repeat unit polymerase n=1 Tax=Chamaesiphon polymorphus CCALA 037 TaxID=2107692 RepID=A0A2T1GMZ7_9CYAN|nr:hypothetical protein [Chamaesiphon polymorphus]PSB59250.1 hypothetical protein C7B77_01745 [Chamaesiphon polymorphus CCALA 037]